MQNNENMDEWINWIEEAISKNHIKYYEFEDFKNIQEIGYEAFGKVFRANWKDFDHYLALKSFYNFNNITLKEIVHELKIQRDVDFHAENSQVVSYNRETKPFLHLFDGSNLMIQQINVLIQTLHDEIGQ
ncbi:unnamed protein product [Rhizophagus irregularis]|nr:unnamed protein product [Rhizophagus irregularis]